jgi:hypothetical protein
VRNQGEMKEIDKGQVKKVKEKRQKSQANPRQSTQKIEQSRAAFPQEERNN